MKKRKVLKTFSTVIAMLLAFSLMAGCQKVENPKSSTASSSVASEPARDPITIKVFVPIAGPATSVDTEVGKVIKEKFNITLEFAIKPPNFNDLVNVYLAGGDYPEVLVLPDLVTYQKYIDAGALISLDDYLKDMPNFTKERADQIPLWRSESTDGKLYKWENASPQSPAAFRDDFDAVVRTDALEKQSWPETIYESQYITFLKQALKDFPKTGTANTIGLTFAGAETWGTTMPFVMYEKGDSYSPLNAAVAVDIKNYKYVSIYSLPETKQSAKFFNKLYLEGLLDKECFTLMDAECLAKMTTGQAVVDFYARWNTASANVGLVKNGTPERQYIELPIRLDSQKGQKRQFIQTLVRTNENIVMTKNMKNPERFLELLDWWQTDEAQKLYGTGVENVDYKVENGKRVPLEPLISYLKGTNPDWAMKSGTMESFLYSGCLGGRYDNSKTDNQPFRITKDPEIVTQYGLSARQQEAYTALGWKNAKSWYDDNGQVYYDGVLKGGVVINPDSDMAKNTIKIGDVAKKYVSQLVFAKNDAEFETIYAKMLAEMDAFKPMDIVNEYNRVLAEVLAKLKK